MPCQRVGAAIAQIQPGRMTTLAEVIIGFSSQSQLCLGKRHDLDASAVKQQIQFPRPFRPLARRHGGRSLEGIYGSYQPNPSRCDSARELVSLRFSEEYRKQRRRIDDHQEKPPAWS